MTTKKDKKISIVVPCYGTEKYINRCIDSLLSQTYKNIEIIAVNDCSKGNMLEILNDYALKDKRIKVVNNKKNFGLFKTRCIGSQHCTGDFIAFVDSDDYVDIDYYRTMMYSQLQNNSDIVVSEYIKTTLEVKYLQNFMKMSKCVFSNEECLNSYFEQEGKNYRWHTLCNKLTKMDIWKKALPFFLNQKENLVMTEDFAFSSILMLFCKKLSFVEDALYFYCTNEVQSTSLQNLDYKKIKKSVNDIKISFDFVENTMKEKKTFNKYKNNFDKWKSMYVQMWRNYSLNSNKLNEEERKNIITFIDSIDNSFNKDDYPDMDDFYEATTKWNPDLDKLKNQIVNKDIKVISFDIFDTLVQRPFFEPSDLFGLLDKKFNILFNNLGIVKFSKIRREAESKCRQLYITNDIQEITINQIYIFISKEYNLDIKKLNILMEKEKELEIQFCSRRETGYQLYLMAKEIGKKVICTSDMYLPEDTIRGILNKNGYTEIDELYLSSNIFKSKSTGDLYKYVIDNEKTNQILHIGDNWYSDNNMASKSGIVGCSLPRAINVFMNQLSEYPTNYCGTCFQNFELFNQDLGNYTNIVGVRYSLAIIANKFFDNPFITFDTNSDFNEDPYFIGYYLLGMHLLSLSNWLLNDTKKNNVDSLAFMARDGYLPLRAAKILQKNTNINNKTNLKYVYVSRKALMPLLLNNMLDFYAIDTYLEYNCVTPNDLIKQLSSIIDLPNNYVKVIEQEKYILDEKFKSKDSFNKFLNFIYNNFYSSKKYNNLIKISKRYFGEIYSGTPATFDVGYSGKPELIISNLINKPIITYFIHINDSTGFNNSRLGKYVLKKFYEFKPTFTGTLRELLISDIGPSCIGYEEDENGNTIPKFAKKKEYTYFNRNMLSQLQTGALDFINDFSLIFSSYIEDIDLNRYYLSIPYEYYLNYSKYNDRKIFDGLTFEGNVGVKLDLNKFFETRRKEYNSYCNKNVTKEIVKYDLEKAKLLNLPIRRKDRLKYYVLHDRKLLFSKIGNKISRIIK